MTCCRMGTSRRHWKPSKPIACCFLAVIMLLKATVKRWNRPDWKTRRSGSIAAHWKSHRSTTMLKRDYSDCYTDSDRKICFIVILHTVNVVLIKPADTCFESSANCSSLIFPVYGATLSIAGIAGISVPALWCTSLSCVCGCGAWKIGWFKIDEVKKANGAKNNYQAEFNF